jgi:hypothetical protein
MKLLKYKNLRPSKIATKRCGQASYEILVRPQSKSNPAFQFGTPYEMLLPPNHIYLYKSADVTMVQLTKASHLS